ncbi:aminotransferase class V-fold PLP-dependent enzyme [Halonatronum saccharophilum]|uniref:aminotransferase class V-fold PLP-dependent enzyme n=1 Tax=Halonatronum saccharophilum TaxID=150060 RepID=UPI000485014C|nr:aminotransferase class V-fold PLP-dependent enzyme [Halonatronum saccharophilum]
MISKSFFKKIRKEIIGLNKKVPLLDGRHRKYINLDNGASTPSFRQVFSKMREFLNWYSNVHRGSGFKSRLSTEVYDKSHSLVFEFLNGNFDDNTIIFVKNATEGINKIANTLEVKEDEIIISSLMEHHSNILPWRKKGKLLYVGLTDEGRLDLEDLESKLKEHRDKVKLVAISGASNVTGIINPIYKIAKLSHQYGAKILVDAAQLIPHRQIDVKSNDHPEHIDLLVFSAHKLYAPFGTGVIFAPKKFFKDNEPDYSGGGTVKVVTLEDVIWANLPDKEEAGTPNIVGAFALSESIKTLNRLGWDNIIGAESLLTDYTLRQLQKIPQVQLYCNMDKKVPQDHLAVIPFNIKGIDHSLVAAILADEYGIGVRNGCFCAHPYINHLLDIGPDEAEEFKERAFKGDYSDKPGLVRISFGCYNNLHEVKYLIKAIKEIIARHKKGEDLSSNYKFDENKGEYKSVNKIDFNRYFKF